MGRFDHHVLDDVIHSRIRLAVVSLLATFEEADFTYLRDQVATTDGNLTTHLRKLLDAGYVQREHRPDPGRGRTTYSLTPRGRKALDRYLTTLQELLPG